MKSFNRIKTCKTSGDTLNNLNNRPEGVQARGPMKHAGVANCLDFIAANFSRPIGVADLAHVSGLSRRGFYRAFQKHAGLLPGQALRRLRVEHAKQLLVESDLSLDEIATRCGYRSANTFWVAFREVTGLAPKKFQRQAWLAAYLHHHKPEVMKGGPPAAFKALAIDAGNTVSVHRLQAREFGRVSGCSDSLAG